MFRVRSLAPRGFTGSPQALDTPEGFYPSFDGSVFLDQLEVGNLIGASGDPIAADVALFPFALFFGLGPIADAVEGTLLNITGLIP